MQKEGKGVPAERRWEPRQGGTRQGDRQDSLKLEAGVSGNEAGGGAVARPWKAVLVQVLLVASNSNSIHSSSSKRGIFGQKLE